MACMPRFPIIFVMSENYADSRLFEKWTTLAAWQLQQLLLAHYLSSPQKNKKEEK